MAGRWVALMPARWWRQVTPRTLGADAIAGFTGATIVLPQAVAFAAIAGLPPEYGLFTAMVTPVVAALFGSSMLMVSGPTTAISAVVFSVISGIHPPGSAAFVQMALTVTVMVGVMQVAFGLAGVGRLAAFVSPSVMLGFTAAAAVLIAVAQAPDALGVAVEAADTVFERAAKAVRAAPEADWRAVLIAATALVSVAVFRLLSPRAPNFLLALALASGVGYVIDAEREGVRMVGALPSVIPAFSLPAFPLNQLGPASEAAFAIALIGLLEAISIGRAFAGRARQPFDADQETVGQGLSNTVGGLFQCYPGSGSFTRSGLNAEAGAQTPMAAIFASAFLFGILWFLAPVVAHIPIPALAGVIFYVAAKLIAVRAIANAARASRAEAVTILATFVAGLVVKLEFSIYVGVILSLLIFLSKTARPTLAISAPDPSGVFRNAQLFNLPECPQIVFTRLDGPLYFGSAEAVTRAFREIERRRPSQKHVVLMLKGMGDIDFTGAEVIAEEARRRRAMGGSLSIVTRYAPLMKRLTKLGVIARLDKGAVYPRKADAIEGVTQRLSDAVCAKCAARIFRECAEKPGAPQPREPAAQETAAAE
ncbi:MAG: SulP family inorganic anion transporter [Rhodobacteraceae bacterium]|nr:MAG: SulP family inorganic anion transporter [Paracoccaceae bacterium]